MASNYFNNSISNSASRDMIESFVEDAAQNNDFLNSYLEKFPNTTEFTKNVYENGLQGLDTLDGMLPEDATDVSPVPSSESPPAWTFITAPEDVSWDIANQANRVDMFGTNNPPVVAGSRGMRDLSLSNSLVEGFVRGVTIEGKVAALEKLMNYGMNSSDGFVSVPVYQVWANSKSYGGPEAYYIIKDVKVKEAMRDLKGNATRAYVDISLMQVPAYQVNSGRDQASEVTSGAKSALLSAIDARNIQEQANQNVTGKGGTTKTNPKSKPNSGASAPASKPATSTAPSAPAVQGDPLRGERVMPGAGSRVLPPPSGR